MKGKIKVKANILNKLFAGKGKLLKGEGYLSHNISLKSFPKSKGKDRYDYHLLKGSRAIDSGLSIDDLSQFNAGHDIAPRFEYEHKSNYRSRDSWGTLDVGAFEYDPISRISSQGR